MGNLVDDLNAIWLANVNRNGSGGFTERETTRILDALRLVLNGSVIQTLLDGSQINWDVSSGQYGVITLGGNRVINNPTNLVDGGIYILEIIQDNVGGRTITSWGSMFTWSGGSLPTLAVGANKIDIFTFSYRDKKLKGVVASNF